MVSAWLRKIFGPQEIISPFAPEHPPEPDLGSKIRELLQKKREGFGEMIKAPFQPVSVSGTVSQEKQDEYSRRFQEEMKGRGFIVGKEAEALGGPMESEESLQQTTQQIPQQVSQQAPQYEGDTSNLVTQYIDKPPFPNELIDPLFAATTTYNIDPDILAATLAQETGGTGYKAWKAVGPDGEVGIAQIIPKYWYQYGNWPDEYNQKFSNVDDYATTLREDISFSIMEAARILSFLTQQHGGNYSDALAAYNAGGNLEAGRGYSQDILNRAKKHDK